MTDPGESTPPRRRRWGRIIFVVLLPFALAARWLAPPLLGQLAFFQLRNIRVEGTRYMDPRQVALRMRADTLQSIWDDTEVLARRIASHPQVASVDIDRRLPGTLIVRITEIAPVALVPGRNGLDAVDSLGRVLPVDPSRTPIDLPVAASGDTSLLGLLGRLRSEQAFLFSRISDASRAGTGEIVLYLTVQPTPVATAPVLDSLTAARPAQQPRILRVRVPVGVSVQRLSDIFPVEIDLARRKAMVAELDLRYRDQVIARLQ